MIDPLAFLQRRTDAARAIAANPKVALHNVANGPIMDPARIFLPAGRCSEAEVIARNRVETPE